MTRAWRFGFRNVGRAWRGFFQAHAPATSAALFRIVFAVASAYAYKNEFRVLADDPSSGKIIANPIAQGLLLASFLFLAAGFKTRAAAWAQLILSSIARLELPNWVITDLMRVGSIYLVFMDSGKAWSVDSLRHPREPREVPLWPIALTIIHLGIMVFLAGLWKAFDADWSHGRGVALVLARQAEPHTLTAWIAQRPWLCRAANYWVIAGQISFVFLVWIPYLRWLAWLNWVGLTVGIAWALGLHQGVALESAYAILCFEYLRRRPIAPPSIVSSRWAVPISLHASIAGTMFVSAVLATLGHPELFTACRGIAPLRYYDQLMVGGHPMTYFSGRTLRAQWPKRMVVETRSGRIIEAASGLKQLPLIQEPPDPIPEDWWSSYDSSVDVVLHQQGMEDPVERIVISVQPVRFDPQNVGREGPWLPAVEVIFGPHAERRYRWLNPSLRDPFEPER